MELAEDCVDLVTVPGWLSSLWLQQADGAVVGEIQPDSSFLSYLDKTSSSSVPDSERATPAVFEQVVIRQAVNTYAVENLGEETTGKKKVTGVKNVINLRPKDVDDPSYVAITSERRKLSKEQQNRSKLVDARPKERVITSVGDQNLGNAKRRRP